MIKVHCFVSCVCELLKKTTGVDHRPYYFGVWDSDFTVTDQYELAYHSDQMDHDFFVEWYEQLYGISIVRWYDKTKTKEENMETMIRLITGKSSSRHVMVMLDLSMLPERENKFHQKPFPHYVMLEQTEREEEWLMLDPDFRWEGVLPKSDILAAIGEPSVEGGYYFDAESIRPPAAEAVHAYFHTCLKKEVNPFTAAIRLIVRHHCDGGTYEKLAPALKQIPVLAIRKYAYEHAFAFLLEPIEENEELFEQWCDEIEQLVQGYTAIQYRVMKLSMTGSVDHVHTVLGLLDRQDQREYKVKQMLLELFQKWEARQTVQAGGMG